MMQRSVEKKKKTAHAEERKNANKTKTSWFVLLFFIFDLMPDWATS